MREDIAKTSKRNLTEFPAFLNLNLNLNLNLILTGDKGGHEDRR